MTRPLDAYMDAVHHLAWLAICDHDEQAHGGLNCAGVCPGADAMTLLSDVSAMCDGPKVATPAEYIGAACDLLNLAAADESSPKRAREIRAAVDMLADVQRRSARVRS